MLTPDPPFPVPDPVPSYWRQSVGPIDTHRSTTELPSQADIVIIGAGYVGASVVYHILEECARSGVAVPTVLMLEAREACSGATGRNGGHFKPDPLSRAASVLATHGPAVAEHVASFEARQVDAIKRFVELEGLDCDFEETVVRDVCLYDAGQQKIKQDLALITEAGISTAKGINYFAKDGAEEASGVHNAKSCHTYPAARLWPYKLVMRLLEKAIAHGVNLQTFTPVSLVSAASAASEHGRWIVKTARGIVEANTVVYATNGYTSALVPKMKDKIVPVRGIVARLAGDVALKMTDSYMLRFSDYEYDYMIPRPDGSIILGGGRSNYYHNLNAWYDAVDDSKLIESARGYFDGYMQRHFIDWESSNFRTEEIWTGIMGYSDDGFPYVGPLCESPGQYLCAGFSGHGMPQIFFSAKAIATMILTGHDYWVDLPQPYRITPSRWSEKKEHVSLKMWRDLCEPQPSCARL